MPGNRGKAQKEGNFMAYRRLSPLDVRSADRWRGVAFGRIQSGEHVGRWVSVVEFSGAGCRIRDSSINLKTGDTFHMLLEDVGPMVADVRWRKGAFFGVRFRHGLTAVPLNHLRKLVEQPLQQRMAALIASSAPRPGT